MWSCSVLVKVAIYFLICGSGLVFNVFRMVFLSVGFACVFFSSHVVLWAKFLIVLIPSVSLMASPFWRPKAMFQWDAKASCKGYDEIVKVLKC